MRCGEWVGTPRFVLARVRFPRRRVWAAPWEGSRRWSFAPTRWHPARDGVGGNVDVPRIKLAWVVAACAFGVGVLAGSDE